MSEVDNDLELNLSDSELNAFMPSISPNQCLLPITTELHLPETSSLTELVLDDNKFKTIADEKQNTIAKKSRKPRTKKEPIVRKNKIDDENNEESNKSVKPAVSEQSFTLGLTKDCFTQEELSINPLTQIFIENSRITNNELIKYQAVKAGILDYKCYGKGCPTKDGNWRRRLGFLILVRNNNRDNDLRMTNLSFLCPNCYCQEKGVMAFEKLKKEIVKTCTFCGTVLDTKYNSDKCGRCAWQIKNQIQKSANIDRLSRAFGCEVDGLSASNMAILMNSSILDEATSTVSGGHYGVDTHKYSGASVSSGISTHRMIPQQTVNPAALKLENSIALKRLFMELSEQ